MVAMPGMLLIVGEGVDVMEWWRGGSPFEVEKLKAASTTVSPAAAQAAAAVRRRKDRRAGSVIGNVLPGDHARRHYVRTGAIWNERIVSQGLHALTSSCVASEPAPTTQFYRPPAQAWRPAGHRRGASSRRGRGAPQAKPGRGCYLTFAVMRRRMTQRHLAMRRSRTNPNSSNRVSGPVCR